MIYRIYPRRDTFITNVVSAGVRQTGSNVGLAEELQVFKRAGISGALGQLGTGSLARSLLQFDMGPLTELSSSLLSAGESYTLSLVHKTSAETLPSGYDLIVQAVSSSWDEGRGLDVSNFGDDGAANWIKRTSLLNWASSGGDVTGVTASFHVDLGNEDLSVDVSPMVQAWKSAPNNGLMIRMQDAVETESNYTDYYVKKFYSRHSSYEDRRPFIEARFNDFRGDDRKNMQWGRTGSLYLYNHAGGDMVDLTAPVTVSITDSSALLTTLTASKIDTGVYRVQFALSSGSYTGSIFYDKWKSAGGGVATGSFSLNGPTGHTVTTKADLIARVKNLRDQYMPEEVIDFEVAFRKRPQRQPVLSTASADLDVQIVEKCYYAIENEATRQRVVPFGTGSLEHTRLSYDGNGNRFRFHMTNLHAGNVYRIIFLVHDGGRRDIIDAGHKFKVI